MAFLDSTSSGVGSPFSSTSSFPPFLAAFFSYFFAPLPAFLFFSSDTSSSLLNSLNASAINFSKRGKVSYLIISNPESTVISTGYSSGSY